MAEENGNKVGDAAQSVLASLKSKEVVIPAVATAASVVAYAARKGATESDEQREEERKQRQKRRQQRQGALQKSAST